MSHEIDMSNNSANIAYVGEKPWHGLGRALTPDAGIEVWRREAGLDYTVERSVVQYVDGGETRTFDERHVLYRSDTRKPLSVVSDGYNIVQPAEILDFIAQCVRHAGFQMEVAGALLGGRKVWALARVADGAPVIGHDVVRPYLLAATSYDGTLSTTFKFTAIRVVCDNTITMAAGGRASMVNGGQTESDKTEGEVVTCVRVPHSAKPDFEAIRRQLGIVLSAWDRFIVEARLLASTPVDETFCVEFLKRILPQPQKDGKPAPVEDGRTFKRLMDIVTGRAPSATLPEANGTAWGLLNAITWYVDHERGSDDARLNSAWFGTGDGLKSKARDLLVAVAS